MPVKPLISPARAFLYSPLGSRFSQTSNRGIDEDLDEVALLHRGPHGVAIAAIGADEGGQRDQAGIANNLATAPMRRMFSSRSWAEKPSPNRLANSSPWRSLSMPGPAFKPMRTLSPSSTKLCSTSLVQFVVDQIRDRALSARAQAGEPNHATLVPVELFALFARDAVFVPGDVGIVGHALRRAPSSPKCQVFAG